MNEDNINDFLDSLISQVINEHGEANKNGEILYAQDLSALEHKLQLTKKAFNKVKK